MVASIFSSAGIAGVVCSEPVIATAETGDGAAVGVGNGWVRDVGLAGSGKFRDN